LGVRHRQASRAGRGNDVPHPQGEDGPESLIDWIHIGGRFDCLAR
jgi:hypothetical protein